jgi:hypothetical protein
MRDHAPDHLSDEVLLRDVARDGGAIEGTDGVEELVYTLQAIQ